jgi:hypothetical protein
MVLERKNSHQPVPQTIPPFVLLLFKNKNYAFGDKNIANEKKRKMEKCVFTA